MRSNKVAPRRRFAAGQHAPRRRFAAAQSAPRRSHGPTLIALAIALLSCAGRDADVSCSPTLSCTLHDQRFEPPPEADAGPDKCREKDERCRASQISAGARHACAAARAGELLCWGDDSEGQLGVQSRDAGAEDSELDAGLHAALQHVERFATGGAHTCALTSDGALYCWGRNAEGQVDGEASDQPERAPVAIDVTTPTAVCAGATHTCVVADHGVWCWGNARFGQSGREVTESVLPPGLVPGTADAVDVACGTRHSCARMRDGQVMCWGELVDDNGEPLASAEPALVPELDGVTEIAAGAGHSCALLEDGQVWCWGQNASGQLGDGTTTARATPVRVQGLELSLHVAAGGLDDQGTLIGHSCAQTKSFHAQCWGRNREGQLGIGAAPDSSTATVVLGELEDAANEPYLTDVTSVATGGLFTCILDNHGPVRCWGTNDHGELGLRSGEMPTFGRPTNVGRFSRRPD